MFGDDISQVAAQAREFERSGQREKFLQDQANDSYNDGEDRQLFPVEIDPAMDRYLRQKGEGWQADAFRSWQRGKKIAADLRKGGDDPMRTEKERVLGEERAKVQEYINERTRRGMPLFPDALAFKSAQEDEAEYARRKEKVDWHRSVFNGDLKKVPERVKKEFEAQFFPDNELGDELRARSLVLGWALDNGGYTENQVSARNGVPLLEQMAIRLKEQGEQIDFNKPGLTVYRFLSRRAQEDAQADERLKGAAESVRQAVLTGGDGQKALWEQRGSLGEEMYKKVGNTLRWVKADAERTRRELEPILPRVMEGLEWAVKYADGTANRIFQQEGMASIHAALKVMDGLTDAQMDALAEVVQRKGGNENGYAINALKAGNRGWEDLGNGIRSLLRGGIAAQLDVAGGVKELFGGEGSALKADAKAVDEYGRRLDAFLAMAQGTYRPINKPEYGWFGNGVLSAVRSVPITALSFSSVGAGVAAMSYAGDSYSKAVQERPDGGRLARLGGAAASGAVQGALDRAGAIVAKGVMGLRSGSVFVDKWMNKLNLSRQAMKLKSSALRAGARSGVAGGMVLAEEGVTEKLQDLADPVMQSLASVMAGEAPGIDWGRFWKDFTDRDQNMELFGSVLAFALVGAGARFTAEAGMQRQLSREYGKLKRTFGFSDSLLARMRAEESDVARYAMMQDGIQDFMRRNYGKDVDGVKVGLGDADGMRKLAARGGVRTMDVVAAAEAHAAETARGVDEVRVDGAEVQDGKGAVVDAKGPESGGVSEVGSGPVLSFEHGPVPERKGRKQVDEAEAMRQYVEAVNEQLKEFGASPIREERNEFTEEMQYVVELGDRPEFYDTYDDAYEAVLRHLEAREDEVVEGLKSGLRQYRDKGEGYVGRVQDEANEEMMQHLSDVGQDGRMSFDRSKMSVPMTLAQLKMQGDSIRRSAEGRERIYAAQMGAEAGVDAARLRVYGANVAQEFANGRYEVVSRLYRGANPFDVYEEWTEGMTKVLIRDNEWTVAEFEDELKRLEEATGEKFLVTGEGVDGLQAVCEGVSRAARAHLMGHISDERLPDKLRRWFKMFALLFAKYFEFAQDLTLAKKMLGADVQGKMSEKFRRLLNDFAGFDEEAIAERARREEQAQIEAEAIGDVPEIGEWVAGRLPHPKTAAEAGSDLTGELQRIYDALTTTRTAKGRRKKDGTLGKGFEQRVVARAEPFFSRDGGSVSDVLESANEAGFDFADSGEMLSAVYDSVVYGYKRYAARGEGQEVSFSMGDRVRRVPVTEARRVAAAFHQVEGMKPVAADVPEAYAANLKDALRAIRERYRVLQKETQEQGYALVMGDGKQVQVGGKGWREVKQHAADRRVLAALAVLPELARHAEFIHSAENVEPDKKRNIQRFHYYLAKANFPQTGEHPEGEAYVNMVVAEDAKGNLFYDLDASSVEEVNENREVSEVLHRSRVPNTGEAEDGTSHKGRIQSLKEFVNYVDRDLAGQDEAGATLSASDQRGRIVEAAKEAGTYMMAPNGEPTNLSEEQWVQVRTPEFKQWFGDWENEPQNASKVVDENGEPLVVYHGSNAVFTVFDPELGGSNFGKYEEDSGFVFTTSDQYDASMAAQNAREFENERRLANDKELLTEEDEKEYSLFINLRNPLVYNLEDNPFDIFNDFDKREPWVWDYPLFAQKAKKEFDDGDEDWNDYDGIILKGESSTWALATTPEQLKSATENRGTFDGENPDITFSVRALRALDREYLEAVEKGDMEKAQRMVNEFAKEKGYLTGDEEWKDMHRAPNSKGASSAEERGKNGDDLSMLDMAKGVMNVPKDFWTHPEWYGNNEPTHSDSFYKVRRLIERAKKYLDGPKKSVHSIPGMTVYRAVPKDIKEGTPRNADWVTPSREYAQEHGDSRFGAGKYSIQRIFARADQLWWDSNDVNELGYDNGNNYAYQNTKNNRKLLDPVTYEVIEVRDENGEHEGYDLGEWDSEKMNYIKIPYRFNYEKRIVPLSKRFNSRNFDESFAMRMMRGGQSVWDYLTAVQGQAYEQEARLYDAMQKRLESALQMNGFTRDGVYKDEKGKDDEAVRERMLAVMAVCDAVVTELPRDVRGGIRPEVVASYREEVMEKKTWRGRMNALMRMVKYVDWHIVNEGVKSRFKEFERFRRWAAASVGENRVRRGKMNAEIQKRLDMVERALELDADELETAKNTAEKVVEEKALIGGAEYDEAVEWVRALDAFGGLYERNMHGRLTADLERVQAALDSLKEMYAAGRLANEAFWEDRRERIADLLDEAGKGLGREQPVIVNERTGAAKHDVGARKGVQNLMRGFLSFENLMEDVFGEGKVTEFFAEGVRKARLEFNDVRQKRVLRYYGALYRIARPEEFLKRADRKIDGQMKLGVRRVVDGMLKDLSENRTWGIEVKMPGEFRSERVRIEEARAVAEGKMEAEQMPKWAKNQKAMDALKMALSEIPAMSRKEFVKFSWLEQGAELVEMEMSDLEAAYLLQMSAMPEYEDNLEALGFDAAAIGKVRDHIDVRALRVAEYLGEEYERGYGEYNEVYRRLFGCDMPKVQNYAPGFFVVDNAAEAVDPMESRGSGWLSVGSIKMRRKHYALPRVVSCVNAYWAHSMQMDHWASFAEIMRDMKAVLLNGELGNKIDAVHGAQARTHLTKWVKDLEFDGSQDSGGAGQAQQVVSRVLGAMAQGALSYNLKTCLKQLPAMFSSMADMSPSDAMKGFIGALVNPGQLAEIWQSPVIQQRLMQGMSPEMRQALTAHRMKVSMLGDAVESGMLPIGLTDAAFTTFSGGIAYMAAKKRAMKEGLGEEEVQKKALAAMDKAVRRTAQPIETEQKSPWEIHAGVLGRMMMMFRSDPRKQLALSYMAISKWRKGEIGAGEAAWRFGQAWVVYGIMNQVIVEFLTWVMGQDDEDEELDLWDRWKGFVVSGAMGALSGIYGVSELIECVYSKLTGDKYMAFGNAVSDHVDTLWRGVDGIRKVYNGEEEEYGKVMNQLGRGLNGTGVFAALGVPEFGAAVQVMGRVIKETKAVAGAWGHLWDEELAKAKEQQKLIRATRKDEKKEREAKLEERRDLLERVRGLDYSSRMKVYQDVGLDKEERKLMENRVKMDGASEVVKAVSRIKKDKRKELVDKLKGTMSEVEYEEFVAELKEKGVKWK